MIKSDEFYKKCSISIIGLGYVGLPLALEIGKRRKVIGYDVSSTRISELNAGYDVNKDTDENAFVDAKYCFFTHSSAEISQSGIYIVSVPTPLAIDNRPDLSYLLDATTKVGSYLKKGDIVIYESTVFPGATEEVCVPLLQNTSKLKYNKDFFIGYSPERINPGDRIHTITNVKKITSGSNKNIAKIIDNLYAGFIPAGTFRASSIRVAEAAKVIENTQRDINIALINELSQLFDKLNIDTEEVLEAARTKWNFLDFRPGLVGGHCIGVDPHYLTFKSLEVGFTPEMILAGRKVNEKMGAFIASKFIKRLDSNDNLDGKKKVLILGFSFKENVKDIRNTKVISIVKHLEDNGFEVDIFDPICADLSGNNSYGLKILGAVSDRNYDGAIIAVAHQIFKEMGLDAIKDFLKENGLILDVKSIFKRGKNVVRI